MFRKEEAAVTDWSEETVLMCARRQAEILHSASVMLRPGGRLVYSTCTFAPEENEASVSAFLRAHPDFSIGRAFAPWFSPGRPDWISDPMPGLEKTFRLMPHRLLGEGHYCAVLRKSRRCTGRRTSRWSLRQSVPKELDDFCKQTRRRAAGGARSSCSDRTCILRRRTFRASRGFMCCARVWNSARCAKTASSLRTRGRCG